MDSSRAFPIPCYTPEASGSHLLEPLFEPTVFTKLKALTARYQSADRSRVRGGERGPVKYLELERWVPKHLHYANWLAPRGAPLKILDLGMGAGYFLYLCKQNGHHVVGLDVDRDVLYAELAELFQITRVLHKIRPFEPLPEFEMRFDLITAFQIVFNGHRLPSLWGIAEWSALLLDMVRHLLTPGGRIFLEFNREPNGEAIPASLLEWFHSIGANSQDGRFIDLKVSDGMVKSLGSPPTTDFSL